MNKKSDKNKGLLISNPTYETENNHLDLLRVLITPEFTKIDLGYQADSKYIRGGWVTIHKNTFIRLKKQTKKLYLTKSDNITYAPSKINFDTNKDYLYFSLYFPPIPTNTDSIDLIEQEPQDSTYFNFYNVELSKALNKDKVIL